MHPLTCAGCMKQYVRTLVLLAGLGWSSWAALPFIGQTVPEKYEPCCCDSKCGFATSNQLGCSRLQEASTGNLPRPADVRLHRLAGTSQELSRQHNRVAHQCCAATQLARPARTSQLSRQLKVVACQGGGGGQLTHHQDGLQWGGSAVAACCASDSSMHMCHLVVGTLRQMHAYGTAQFAGTLVQVTSQGCTAEACGLCRGQSALDL
jgi:hypothetical protein